MRTFALLCVAALAASAQPAGVVVTHAASRMLPQLPETGLAPGSLFEINVYLLDAVTLRFRAPGSAALVELPMLKSGALGRFFALVPPGTPPGEAEVAVSDGAGKTFITRAWIAASNLGLFADAAQVWRNGPEQPRLTAPILPGEWVTLWGTGLGNASTLSIDVAGIPVTPSFAGPAPGQPGLDQINFQFPAGVPEDCYIPMTAMAAGRASNVAVVPAAAVSGPCRHRLGLGTENLAALDNGGRIPVSAISVHSDIVFRPDAPGRYSRFESVSLDMFLHDAAGVRLATGVRDSETPREGCTLNAGGGIAGFIVGGRTYDFGRPELAGPDRRRPMDGMLSRFQAMLSDPEQTYELPSVPASAFAPGEWAVEAPGGADIDAFRVPLRMAPPLRWLNRAALPRLGGSAAFAFSWDPVGYTDSERVRANLTSGLRGISCEAPATAGSITVPASLIAQLTPDPRGPAMASLLLVRSNLTPSLYSLPLKNGGAVRGIASFSFLESVTVTWE